MNKRKLHPSAWWYSLAGAVGVFGFVCSWAVIIWLLSAVFGGMQRVTVPRSCELELPRAGQYLILYEYEGATTDRAFSEGQELALGLEFSLRGQQNEEELPISRTDATDSYESFGSNGVVLFEFRVPHPGTYVLAAHYPDGRKLPKLALAVTRPFLEQLLIPGLALMVFGMCIVTTSAVIFWLTFLKRRAVRRQYGGANSAG